MSQITFPTADNERALPYLPQHQFPIPESELGDEKLAAFIERHYGGRLSVRGYNQWMESVGYPMERISATERARLIMLCTHMSRCTPQWLRLLEFDQPDILNTLHHDAAAHPVLLRNQQLKELVYRLLLEGMPKNDSSRVVFGSLLPPQHGVLGDEITQALTRVNSALNKFLINTQRHNLYLHNMESGHLDPEEGYAFWPSQIPMDFMFDETLEAAWQVFDEVCESFDADRDEESVRSRLLKDAVLVEENRYWTGVQDSHQKVLGNISEFIPANISELRLPTGREGVLAAVRELFDLDRRSATKSLLREGEVLLDLYRRNALLDPPSENRAVRELTITCTVALQMRRRKAKWPVFVHGQGVRERSAYQAFKSLRDGADPAINPSLRVLLCGAVSMAMVIESEQGMGSFSNACQHGALKIKRTDFFAQIPKRVRRYSAPTVVRVLQRFAKSLADVTPPNPLINNHRPDYQAVLQGEVHV